MTLAKTAESTLNQLVTAEVLWQLSASGKNYELMQGELIEMSPPGGEHGDVASELILLLRSFAKQHQLGKVLTETGFRLASSPDTVRSPDVSFLSAAKIPAAGLPKGFIAGPPDLAVKVVSPNDTASEIQDKVQDYLAHGAQLVWVVYPEQRAVVVHYPDGTARTLHEPDSLTGEAVVPGFTCRVGDIFG